MKIAIISGDLKDKDAVRGIGVHTNELIKALKNEAKNKKNFILDLKMVKSKDYDVIHFTSFKPFVISLSFIKPRGTRFVLTIHDLIPLIYPKNYPPGIKGRFNFLINKLLVKMYVDEIITISETSKKDICRFLRVDPKIVHVIYLAPKEIYSKKTVTKKYNLPKKFALYTGDINYNKNIPNLIRACEIAKIPLVIAGKQALEVEKMDLSHPETSHLKGVSFKNVIRLGFILDEELNDLYNLATVYIQPSLYEGFGLPALEAVAVKTPLVVTKTQALVEILGDNVNYVNPNDPKDIARGILKPNINIKLPREYTWEKTAKETLDVYEKA
ncbi:MAG: glycosyltransferase family 1 protein [bacterium]|nr:glycosyltransferase family 1 protein [bacterium]